MTSEKPHPSEALKFITLSPIVSNVEHTECVSQGGSCIAESIDLPPAGFCHDIIHQHKPVDDIFVGLSSALPRGSTFAKNTNAALASERHMTFLDGVRLYPRAIGWSALLSLTIVMEGFGLSMNNSLMAFPEFRRVYGQETKDHGYQISTAWQSAITNGPVAGEILGLLFNGFLTDKLGYRKTMVTSLAALCLFILLAFFGFNIEMLLVSQILCGLPWGVFQTLSTTYAAEVMPVSLRAYLTSNVNLCWLIGQLVGQGVLRALVNVRSEWSYRLPFGLQWVFGAPLLFLMLFAPESPWLLVRSERYEDAKNVLKHLTRKAPNFNLDETIALMRHTNEVEKYFNNGLSYFDCFRGTDLRRTEIACMIWMIQSLCGSAMTGWAVYFYEQAGLSNERSFDLAIGMYGLAITGQLLSWYSMRHFGRRPLYLSGCILCFIILMIAGGMGTRQLTPSVSWSLGSLITIYTFIYDCTVGPVCYSLVAEIPSTRLRVKTVVLARIAYNIVSLAAGIIMPKMLNPTSWAWGGKTCFLWAGTCFLSIIWCYYRLPEPKGLTYMELDVLFEKRAPARKFHKFQVHLAETGYFSLAAVEPASPKGLEGSGKWWGIEGEG